MPAQFEGKVALVTGAGSGIGRATALAFAGEKAKVVVADVNVEDGKETVVMIEREGGEAIFTHTNVSKTADVEAMVGRAIEVYGRLDCALNNAAIPGAEGMTHQYPEDSWDSVIDVNLKGVWLCMKHEIQHMLERGGGTIVNMASIVGLIAWPGSPAYTAAKHGVVGLTQTAALEYARQGIRVNAVCPSWVRTPMFERAVSANPELGTRHLTADPMGRLAEPEEIAQAVLWLCSDAASFVTGHAMPVDGGYMAH